MALLDVNLADGAIINVTGRGLKDQGCESLAHVVDLRANVYLQLPLPTKLVWVVLGRSYATDRVKNDGLKFLYSQWAAAWEYENSLPARLVGSASGKAVGKDDQTASEIEPFYKAVQIAPVPWPERGDPLYLEDGTWSTAGRSYFSNVHFTGNNGLTWTCVEGVRDQCFSTGVKRFLSAANIISCVDPSRVQLTVRYLKYQVDEMSEPIVITADKVDAGFDVCNAHFFVHVHRL